MKRLIPTLTMAGMVLLLCMTAFCQEKQNSIQPNTIKTSATGEYEAAPDTAVMTCTISLFDKQFKDANTRANKAADGIRDALKINGLDGSAAELGKLALQPIHENKGTKRKITGYRVSTTMTIKISDFSKVGGLMDALAQIDDVDVSPVQYVLKNMEEAKLKAVQLAMDMAKKTAETAAKAGGRTLGDLSNSEVSYENRQNQTQYIYGYNSNRVSQPEAASGVFDVVSDFNVTKTSIKAHVEAIFNLK